MKFKSTSDQLQYSLLNLNEMEVRKRLTLATVTKDQKKSRGMKNMWRRNKHQMMKGIKKWHKSTAGKRFHRALGRFNALRESVTYYVDGVTPGSNHVALTMEQVNDALLSLSSIETHLYLELQYYEADPQAMIEFLDIIDNFVMDTSYLKVELLISYKTGEIETEDYQLLSDIVQFFQDPKMYVYAKRDLLGKSNDTQSENFLAQCKLAEEIDKSLSSDAIYKEIDKLFIK